MYFWSTAFDKNKGPYTESLLAASKDYRAQTLGLVNFPSSSRELPNSFINYWALLRTADSVAAVNGLVTVNV